MDRRRFLQVSALAGLPLPLTSCFSSLRKTVYPASDFGNVTLFHITDCHAQLLPVYYREPSTRVSAGGSSGKPPYLAGQEFLRFYGITPGTKEAHAFTHLGFSEAAKIFGKMGGFAYLSALIRQIKNQSKHGNFLMLDGGDSWQGSATSLWTQGRDMIAASNLLGVDVMTGHWEFTHGGGQVLANLKEFKGEFLAQNVRMSDEAQFASGSDSIEVFKPYVIKEFGKARIAVIGQAYPYTPIANPARFIPDWRFGIEQAHLQRIVEEIRNNKSADVIVLLSHNGMDIDLKLAGEVAGIDIILGGHTHDAIPKPVWISSAGGRTWVTNAGSHGKFLAVLDLEVGKGRLKDLRYRLLPVFSELLEPDAGMQALIERLRRPYLDKLRQPLAVADRLLYRRDTYQGTFDEILLQALLKVNNAEIAFSPGFRWGTTLLPGQEITYEDVLNHTAITYPNTLRRQLTGAELKSILEDAADNLFNPDPYYRQGGDMVRVGGMSFRCDPAAVMGQRISDMRLANGKLLESDKSYMVASWASVGQLAEGRPMAEVMFDYLAQ